VSAVVSLRGGSAGHALPDAGALVTGGDDWKPWEELMWRPAHGATSKPGPCRPASGYGRKLGRPGPGSSEVAPAPTRAFEPGWFVERAEPSVEVDVPVTP